MKVYCVGGALRDEMLGLPVQDRDWVVVGARPEDLLAKGFVAVGKDFPVFLHPRTHEEYALARTERKTGPGYRGFAVQFDASVTLEEDLLRRDLTINAMARGDDGVLIDPYGGQQDLRARLFRHVSPAFAEDPVRVLRVARFAARFTDFSTAPETLQLMRKMSADGEMASLVAERVWQEVARGLMAQQPSRMFDLLREVGVLKIVSPPLDALWAQPELCAQVDDSARCGLALEQRFAVLTQGLGEQLPAFCEAWRIPAECRDLGLLLAREKHALFEAKALPPEALVALFERADAKRKADRFTALLGAAQVLRPFDETRLLKARQVLATLDEAAVARAQAQARDIKDAVHRARVAAIAAMD